MKVFIVGPGGVGKSTAGKILAEKLGYDFIDLDTEFMTKVGHIGDFIVTNGYEKYCYKNSELFYSLLKVCSDKAVIVLSSGFLVHKNLSELTARHYKTIHSSGISVLLLPSKDINEAIDIVVKRQVNRGFGLKAEHERRKIEERYIKYSNFGDIKLYSHDTPENIAEEMERSLVNLLQIT